MQVNTPRWQDILTRVMQQDHQELSGSEVELYQAQPALGLDLAMSWNEAMLPGVLLADGQVKVSAHFPSAWNQAKNVLLKAPFPSCIGLAPQFLQQIDGLLTAGIEFFQMKAPKLQFGTAEVTLDNKSAYSQLAIARLAGDDLQVLEHVAELDGEVLQQNERASQYWLSGDRDSARELWDTIESNLPVIAFNQGLAALAYHDVQRGRSRLTVASQGFAETTGWHHLAELYLAKID